MITRLSKELVRENESLPLVLRSWWELNANDFIMQISESRFSRKMETGQAEWRSYFEENSMSWNSMDKKVRESENALNLLVFKAFGLEKEEIQNLLKAVES